MHAHEQLHATIRVRAAVFGTGVQEPRRSGTVQSVHTKGGGGKLTHTQGMKEKMRADPRELKRMETKLQRMNQILAGNPAWIDLLEPNTNSAMMRYAQKVSSMTKNIITNSNLKTVNTSTLPWPCRVGCFVAQRV